MRSISNIRNCKIVLKKNGFEKNVIDRTSCEYLGGSPPCNNEA